MNVKTCFPGKVKKCHQFVAAELAQRVAKVKDCSLYCRQEINLLPFIFLHSFYAS